jgi:hypothetical protein
MVTLVEVVVMGAPRVRLSSSGHLSTIAYAVSPLEVYLHKKDYSVGRM